MFGREVNKTKVKALLGTSEKEEAEKDTCTEVEVGMGAECQPGAGLDPRCVRGPAYVAVDQSMGICMSATVEMGCRRSSNEKEAGKLVVPVVTWGMVALAKPRTGSLSVSLPPVWNVRLPTNRVPWPNRFRISVGSRSIPRGICGSMAPTSMRFKKPRSGCSIQAQWRIHRQRVACAGGCFR